VDAWGWRIDARLTGSEDTMTVATESAVAMRDYEEAFAAEPAEALVAKWQDSLESFWSRRLAA
jgi:hypothetical protein